MDRIFALMGAVFAFLAVGLGAFGAHGLSGRLSASELEIFETGVRYQMYHALGLLAVAWIFTRWPGTGVVWSGWLFAAGIVVFSGSLYFLATTGPRWLGAITPLGGMAFLAGWALLAVALVRGNG